MGQTIAVYIIGILVVFYLSRKVYMHFSRKKKRNNRCDGCPGCNLKKMAFYLLVFSFSQQIMGKMPDSDLSRDSALANITAQLVFFPQEKIYMQTDKPYYISGEKVFFRIFLLKAFSNQNSEISRYVYVELINPLDSVVIREQIRSEKGLFYGALVLPEELSQGNYKIRAYTRYMENTGEAFFYSQPVYIADPNASKMTLETEFEYFGEKQVGVNLRFISAATKEARIPDRIPLRLNNGKTTALKPDKDGWVRTKFNLPGNSSKRILHIEYGSEKKEFGEYIQIPYPEETVDVSFYPEGGNIIEGQTNKVAFKALLSNGNSANISGKLYNSQEELINEFTTKQDGMGFLSMVAQPGEHYYVICDYKDQSFRVELPESKRNTLALQTTWRPNRLLISVKKPDSIPPQKHYLLIHSRGVVNYFSEWNFSKEFIYADKDVFFQGVSHLLLLTEDFQPVSERLVFVNNDDQARLEVSSQKKTYKKRESAQMDFRLKSQITDSISANFSVSITDDKDVVLDTTTNILAEILLVSELKGRVDHPAYYFRKGDKNAEASADLLMLTQGWNRYDIPEIMRGNLQVPTVAPEVSQSFAGIVKGGLLSRPYKNAQVTIMSIGTGFFDVTETNEEGRFLFDRFEFPDSTTYVIQALTRKGADRVELYVDNNSYPKLTIPSYYNETQIDQLKPDFIDYVSKADLKYTYENGMRVINLPEITVKASRRNEPKEINTYGVNPDFSITEEDMKKFPASDLLSLLSRIPGIATSGNSVSIARYGGGSPLFVVDGMRLETYDELASSVNVNDIAQVDLIKDGAKLVIYGAGAGNGVIEIMTKKGNSSYSYEKFNIKALNPLGYQKPIEFYAPKYDTEEAYNNTTPDLRSTIYWNPSVAIDSGNKVSLDFYTADTPTTYSVVIEGVCSNGQLIYSKEKAIINVVK